MKKPKLIGVKKFRVGVIMMLALFTQTGCQVCACDSGMSNTGIGCGPVFRDTRDLILVPTYDNDGTRNGITLATDTMGEAFFTGKVNETDSSKRWFPIASDGGLKNVEQMREDPVFRSFTDGSKEFIRDGNKPFKAFITGRFANPKYTQKLNSVRCLNMSVYKIDRGGNLVGNISADGTKLYPIQIDSNSFYAVFREATPDQNNAYLEIGFDFSQNELDQNLMMIACNELGGYSLFNLRGLIDVCAQFSNIETTGITVDLQTEWGTALNPTRDQGLEAADFSFTNVTQSGAAIGITGSGGAFTETSPGVYDITFDTADQPNPGDELQLEITKNGRDYTCVKNTEIIVPAS